MAAALPPDFDLKPDEDEDDTVQVTLRISRSDAESVVFFADLWKTMAAVLEIDSTVSWKPSNAYRRLIKQSVAQAWARVGGKVDGDGPRARLKAQLIANAIEALAAKSSSPSKKK